MSRTNNRTNRGWAAWISTVSLIGMLGSSGCTGLAKNGPAADSADGSMNDGSTITPDLDGAAMLSDGDVNADGAVNDGGGVDLGPAPQVTVDFPPAGLTSLAALHMRGAVSDAEGNAITSLHVAGVKAALVKSGAGYTWSATVPLTLGDNDLTPKAQNARGAVSKSSTLDVQRVGPQLEGPMAFVYDASGKHARLFVMDETPTATSFASTLYVIDLVTQAVTIVSGSGRGKGSAFIQPVELALDVAHNRLFVLDGMLPGVLSVDIATGDRSVLSSATSPAANGGPAFVTPSDLVWDAAAGRLLVPDSGADRLFAVDGDTGVRSVVSASGGTKIYDRAQLAFDAADQLVFVISPGGFSVVQIAANGTRTLIADAYDTHGYDSNRFDAITFDDKQHRVLLRDQEHVVELDVTTLQRRLLADFTRASDAATPATPIGLSVDPATGEALVMVQESGELLRVSVTPDPKLKPLSDGTHGTGPIYDPSIMTTLDDNHVLTLDWGKDVLLSVDLRNGNRTVISDTSTNNGHKFYVPQGMSVDATNHRVLVLDINVLLSVDLVTGARTVISQSFAPTVGAGPTFDSRGLSEFIDVSNNRLVALGTGALMAIDLTSGDRSEVSGPNRGTGPLPSPPTTAFIDLAYDFLNSRYIAIGDGGMVLAIDPATGNRTSLAGGTGTGLTKLEQLVIDVHDQVALVLDQASGVMSIELTAGHRRIVQPYTLSPFDVTLDVPRGRLIFALQDKLMSLEIAAHDVRASYTPPGRALSATNGSFIAMEDLASGTAYAETVDGLAVLDLVAGEAKTITTQSALPTILTSQFLDVKAQTLYGTTTSFFNTGVTSVFSADLKTATRKAISTTSIGAGPALSGPYAGTMDTKRKRPMVVDAGLKALLAIDPSSGDRTNLSGDPVGTGTNWTTPSFVKYDADKDRALVLDTDHLVAVNLTTGDRTTLSGAGVGSGPTLTSVYGLALDLPRRQAIVRDTKLGAFVTIGLDDGKRKQLIADPTAGPAQQLIGVWPYDLDCDTTRRTLFARDTGHALRGLMELDELTGDWVTIWGRVP